MTYLKDVMGILCLSVFFILSAVAHSQTVRSSLGITGDSKVRGIEKEEVKVIPMKRGESFGTKDEENIISRDLCQKFIAAESPRTIGRSIEGYLSSLVKPLRIEGGRIKYSLTSWLTGALRMDVDIWSLELRYTEFSLNFKIPF